MLLAFLATWAHCWLIFRQLYQHAQVLFHQAAFQPLFPKPVVFHGVAVAQVQDPALSLVEPHTIDLGPSIQPVQSLPTLKQINTPTQLGVICKLAEGALDPFVQITDKDIKQNWPQHRALGNTTCDRLPTGVNSVHHYSLGLATHPFNKTRGSAKSCTWGGTTTLGTSVCWGLISWKAALQKMDLGVLVDT
ncbi:hypothetical protein QYF61_002045 [Mycteria americana]|uniref:Uncharacterized protein n=1 Tax=Mycteria americana TaxID=33587 RepID=A0AAN7NP89_MYCAM|nr:hypothetical protein QYF61_002045 [Mycteria americana]